MGRRKSAIVWKGKGFLETWGYKFLKGLFDKA